MDYSKCDGKNIYTKNEVGRKKGNVGRRRDKDLRIYKCPKCHGYHLTKKNKKEHGIIF